MRWNFLKGNGRDKSRSVRFYDRLAALFVVIGIVVPGYNVFVAFSGKPTAAGRERPGRESGSRAPESSPRAPASVSFDEYAPVFSGRDFFRMAGANGEEPVPGLDQPADVPAWGNGYKMVGVIVDDNPRAVVEVSDPHDVHFLSPGSVLGEAVLEKVEESGAWFRFRGQQVELKFEGADTP